MIKEILPEQLKEKLDAKENFLLIDCREQDEYDYCKIEGASLIPLSEFQTRAPKELRLEDEIVIYCHHGMRSAQACYYLESLGYNRVFNLSGGIEMWSLQVDSKVKRY